jgi:hypothetical protein
MNSCSVIDVYLIPYSYVQSHCAKCTPMIAYKATFSTLNARSLLRPHIDKQATLYV